ncbi:MAG: CRTAC1 family protein, partial [Planctomycetes bacterium]|nr:CRTAC1 family protein [Planctomycetota bacterium]
APDVLYLNDGAARFAPAPQVETGRGFGFGVCAADVDGDADLDIYLADLGPNRLLRNEGDARLAPVPGAGGAAGAADDWSMCGAFADPDADGDLDLYVTNYLAHDRAHPMIASGRPCRWLGCEVPCGPKGLTPQADRYFVNDGAGGFAEGTQAAGFAAAAPAYAFQAVWTDADGDGLADLFVANDSVPNYLFRNLGPADGAPARFAEVGLAAGCALSDTGKEQAGMGVAVGALDGDSRLDLVMTNFSQEQNAAFRNQGRAGAPLLFDDGTRTGLGWPSFHDLGWGANSFDADLDGDLDVFVANGHVYPQVDGCGISHTTYAQRCRLYEQVAPGRFRDATDRAGPALQVPDAHRGSAAGDLDGDGDIDLLVARLDAPPRLLLNESARAGSWLRVVLAPPASAPGARVTLAGAERTWTGEARAGSSFLGVEDPAALHVGVPDDASFTASVRWPDGRVETFTGLHAGRTHVLTLGSGSAP